MLPTLMLLAALASSTPRVLTVGERGEFASLSSALKAASPGDTIRVTGGVYPGPVLIDKSITLEGHEWPVIDGGKSGTVVTLSAPGIVLRGFEIRGSGIEPDLDHSGVTVTALHVTVENNRLRDVLFGIFVSQAGQCVVRGNDIGGKDDLEEGRRGDAIRLWYSPQVLIENNVVHNSRDTVIWYSQRCTVRGNRIEHGRYGIHLMYTDAVDIENNVLRNNAVGIYVMYSTGVTMIGNDIRGHRGPSGYALGFKDADRVRVERNLLIDNRAAVFCEGTPFQPGGFARFEQNVFAFNEQGVMISASNAGASFTNNTFWENAEQVSIPNSGSSTLVQWRGNYWSDDAGFDLDGDRQNDQPYRADKLFEGLTDREPALRILLYSPAAQALELASSAFPVMRPVPKVDDPIPAAQPLPLPVVSDGAPAPSAQLALAGAVLLLLCAMTASSVWIRRAR
ncbi:MAG: nitrous oxide reductase family maturation protein NosD [Acidobacteriota bacterium]